MTALTPDSAPPAPAGGLEPAAPGEGAWVTARPIRPGEILRRLVTFPALLARHRDLVSTSLRRELAARFHGTVLAWAWPFLQPLLLFGVYYFIFTELLGVKMPNLPDDQKAAMGVYMFVGMVPWSVIGETLSSGTRAIVDNGNLIKKLAFPAELLPFNVVLASMTTMLCGIAMFVLAAVATSIWPAPGWGLLWVPAIFAVQLVFVYGLVLLLSTLHVTLRDTLQIVVMWSTIWMFLTPVFWVPEIMGEGLKPYLPILEANPALHMVQAWRGALMGDVPVALPTGELVHPVSQAAVPGHLLVLACWAVGTYVVGYVLFLLLQRRFADEV
jgi:ABC-type polysaccharide/polyol phosphate export permease